MTLKFSPFLFFLLLSTQLYPQIGVNRNLELNINSNVKLILENSINEKSIYSVDLKSKDSIMFKKIFYNRSGKIIKELSFKVDNTKYRFTQSIQEKINSLDNGELYEHIIYEYNSKGYLKKSNLFRFGKLFYLNHYVYNKNGNKAFINSSTSSDKTFKFIREFKYNKYQQLTRVIHKIGNLPSENDDYILRMKFSYNSNKKPSKIKIYDIAGKLSYLDEFIYHEDEIVKYTQHHKNYKNKKWEIILITNNKYDYKKRLIEREIITPEIEHKKTIFYIYDNKNNVIEENTFINDSLVKKLVHKYKYY
ncbi:hypothetical protein [uncultured Algibacter sp.]|uniref:hypothetical protein n=1 Tax=uncultured Algibacter sp. TaxID=298659 RepID=UPI003216A4B8